MVSSVGDSIRGSFKTEVTYPPEMSHASGANRSPSLPADQLKPRTSTRFNTQRPAFADPGLETLLEEKGVVIEAVDQEGSSWFKPMCSIWRCCDRAASTVASSSNVPTASAAPRFLRVHAKNVPLAPDVSLERIAAETPGLVGAELRNLVNEAALLAARKDASAVGAEDFAEAMQKITLGPARNILLNPAERERTAYHEAGHALLALLVPGGDPVHRVSIVPRGMALGATYQLPVDDRTSYAEDYLRARISSALGGRAAEKLVYGVVTTGAENDLQQVTEIARHMVLRWGMSDKLGPISFVAPQDQGLPPAFQHQPYSEATSELIDAEVRRIVEESHGEADRLLAQHRDKLEALAQALLKAESLNEKEIRDVTGLTEPPGQEDTSARLQAVKR